jgi:hypothetical protein
MGYYNKSKFREKSSRPQSSIIWESHGSYPRNNSGYTTLHPSVHTSKRKTTIIIRTIMIIIIIRKKRGRSQIMKHRPPPLSVPSVRPSHRDKSDGDLITPVSASGLDQPISSA